MFKQKFYKYQGLWNFQIEIFYSHILKLTVSHQYLDVVNTETTVNYSPGHMFAIKPEITAHFKTTHFTKGPHTPCRNLKKWPFNTLKMEIYLSKVLSYIFQLFYFLQKQTSEKKILPLFVYL